MTWSIVAVLLTGLSAYVARRGPKLYSVTVAIRVTEGTLQTRGAQLSGAALRAHVQDLALTTQHLIDVMSKHPAAFGKVDKDSSDAVAEIRENIAIDIVEDDFIGDRNPEDPPRSARVELTYKDPDPKVAWAVAQDLAEVVIGTTLGGARAAIARARAAAAAALAQAQAQAEGTAGGDEGLARAGLPPDPNSPVVRAAERFEAAGGQEVEADLSLRAQDERQGLRLEVIDPGRVPVRQPKLPLPVLLSILVGSVLGSWLVVGALDPRVLDFEDLATLGVPALGGLPPLPGAPRRGFKGKREEASEVPRTSV